MSVPRNPYMTGDDWVGTYEVTVHDRETGSVYDTTLEFTGDHVVFTPAIEGFPAEVKGHFKSYGVLISGKSGYVKQPTGFLYATSAEGYGWAKPVTIRGVFGTGDQGWKGIRYEVTSGERTSRRYCGFYGVPEWINSYSGTLTLHGEHAPRSMFIDISDPSGTGTPTVHRYVVDDEEFIPARHYGRYSWSQSGGAVLQTSQYGDSIMFDRYEITDCTCSPDRMNIASVTGIYYREYRDEQQNHPAGEFKLHRIPREVS